MKRLLSLFIIIVFCLILISCDSTDDETTGLERIPMSNLDIDADFDFQSTREVSVNIGILLRNGEPLPGIGFQVFTNSGGDRIAAGITDETGYYHTDLTVPSYYDSLYIIGFMSSLSLPIIADQVNYLFGQLDSTNRGGDFDKPQQTRDGFVYLDPYNSSGVPDSLDTDIISAEFLTRVDTSLPERYPVPQYHPDYLDPNAVNNIILEELCDVWITFVHEGAGYRNSLGFYTYDEADGPPESADEITHYIAFPNASLHASGGELYAGDKVYLGRFEGGTVIGWFLVANGWTGSSVSETRDRWYSDPQLNISEDSEFSQHTILLYDAQEEKLLLGIEDLRRSSGADDDFNDDEEYREDEEE